MCEQHKYLFKDLNRSVYDIMKLMKTYDFRIISGASAFFTRNGDRGIKIEYLVKYSNTDLRILQYFFAKSTSVKFIASCTVLKSHGSKYDDVFNNIMKSFILHNK